MLVRSFYNEGKASVTYVSRDRHSWKQVALLSTVETEGSPPASPPRAARDDYQSSSHCLISSRQSSLVLLFKLGLKLKMVGVSHPITKTLKNSSLNLNVKYYCKSKSSIINIHKKKKTLVPKIVAFGASVSKCKQN